MGYRFFKYIGLVLILNMLFGCGIYSFKGALPPHAKSIAIPLFDDRTAYPEIRENMTNGVIDAFISDNTLAVVDEGQADLVLYGTIQSIRQSPAVVKSGEQTTEAKLVVIVKLKVEDKVLNKTMVDKTIEEYSFLDENAGLAERDQAIGEIVDLLIDQIFNATLASW